jgi:DNA-binding GntR family transcriptional regulator
VVRAHRARHRDRGRVGPTGEQRAHLPLDTCPNERLLDPVTGVKAGMRRSTHLIAGEHTLPERAAEEHRRIAERLMVGDVPGATEALRGNRIKGTERMTGRIPPVPERR